MTTCLTLLTILLLNILLPTLDTVTDIKLIVKLYRGGIVENLLGNLHINVVRAENLVKGDTFNKSDPYLVVSLGGKQYTSKTIKNHQNLDWNFEIDVPVYEDASQSIRIEVYNENEIVTDKLVASSKPVFRLSLQKVQSSRNFSFNEGQRGEIQMSTDFTPAATCEGHPRMATSLLLPVLLNYILSFLTSVRLAGHNSISNIFALLGLYPQYEASKLIYSIYKDPVKGRQKKRYFDRNIGLHQAFLQSVPTSIILTVNLLWASQDHDGIAAVEFLITYTVSVISAVLGLARCLKNGVARPFGPGGCAEGVLTLRFIMVLLASGLCLLGRARCLLFLGRDQQMAGSFSEFAVTIALLMLPQFVLAVFSTLNFRNKNSLKILYRHPSLLILPTVTFFTFSKIRINYGDEARVRFSRRFTLINFVVSVVGFVFWLGWIYNVRFQMHESESHRYNLIIPPDTLFPLLSSGLLTLLLLQLKRLNRSPCYSHCSPCLPAEQLSVYDPLHDEGLYIMEDGEVVEEPKEVYENSSSSFCVCCSHQIQQTDAATDS